MCGRAPASAALDGKLALFLGHGARLAAARRKYDTLLASHKNTESYTRDNTGHETTLTTAATALPPVCPPFVSTPRNRAAKTRQT